MAGPHGEFADRGPDAGTGTVHHVRAEGALGVVQVRALGRRIVILLVGDVVRRDLAPVLAETRNRDSFVIRQLHFGSLKHLRQQSLRVRVRLRQPEAREAEEVHQVDARFAFNFRRARLVLVLGLGEDREFECHFRMPLEEGVHGTQLPAGS